MDDQSFDELSYLEMNPDVESAVLTGAIVSGYEHWVQHGRAEGRPFVRPKSPDDAPKDWSELRYLKANPDVAAAVTSGGFRSGYQHWNAHGRYEGRTGGPDLFRKAEATHVLKQSPFGFNAFGYRLTPNGLGEAMRGYLEVFRSITDRVTHTDVPLWGAQPVEHRRFDAPPIPYAFNFIHQNADVLPLFLATFGPELLQQRINIGFWVWEMHAGYPAWRRSSRFFHEIWVPSTYVAQALQAVSSAPIAVLPHVVSQLPVSAVPTRTDLRIDTDAFVFLYVFDVASTLGRKNPLLLIRAFRNVFQHHSDAVLLLKYHNSSSDPGGIEAMRRLAAPYPNIRFLDQTMPPNQVYGLFQMADCFVSPHRSEGFGLNIATAMYYGKPVIATGYSGNMDYMDNSTAFCINYELTQAGPGHRHYDASYGWAEPSGEHLEVLLASVYTNRTHAAAVAAAGQRLIRQRHSVDSVASLVRARVEALAKDSGLRETT